MMMLMFSTAGVPPFVGFWAKLRIFQALWETNHVWLVVIVGGHVGGWRVLLPARRSS